MPDPLPPHAIDPRRPSTRRARRVSACTSSASSGRAASVRSRRQRDRAEDVRGAGLVLPAPVPLHLGEPDLTHRAAAGELRVRRVEPVAPTHEHAGADGA